MTASGARAHAGIVAVLGIAVAVLVVLSAGGARVAPTHAAALPGGPPRAGGTSASVADPPSGLPSVVATVPVGSEPLAGAIDTATGLVYIANSLTNNVSVLSGSTLVGTVNLTANQTGTPLAVVYDPVNGYVYVVDRYDFETATGAVNVIEGTSVLATIPVGHMPSSATVDTANGEVYITNSGGTTVTILEDLSALGSVTVGSQPLAAAYDPSDGSVYVANAASDNVSEVTGAAVTGSVPVGTTPDAVAYDPADSQVYVANNGTDNVSVLDGTAAVGAVPVGSDPTYVGYVPSLGAVEVANTNSSSVTVINGTTAVATFPVAAGPVWVGPGPNPAFDFAVAEYANQVSVLAGMGSVVNLTVGSVPVAAVADPADQDVYVVNAGSNTVSIIAPTFPVTFNETGLADGVAWSVTLGPTSNASTTSSIGFTVPAGTFDYSIATPPGYALTGASPASPLTVTDQPVVVNVTFAPLPTTLYNLTFVETGLSSGCQGGGGHGGSGGGGSGGGWGGGSGFGGWQSPAAWPQGSGGGCCHGSTPSWSVTVNGVTKTSTNTSITFPETDGVYNYTVDAPQGYTVRSSVPQSPVTVEGANVTVNVTFSRCGESRPLSITFQERGLPWGTTWCVTLNATECSSGGSIVFANLSAGTFAFNVSAVAGYTAQPSSGLVQLAYQSETVTIQFTAPGHHHCGG